MGLVKTLVILLLLAVAVALLLWVLHVEPVFGWINPLIDSALHLDFSGVTAQMAAGYASIVAIVGGALGTAYKWLKTRTELLSTQKAVVQSNAQISELANLNEQKDSAITAINTEKEQLKLQVTELQSVKTDAEKLLEASLKREEQLRSQIDGISKMNVDKLGEDVATKVKEKLEIK